MKLVYRIVLHLAWVLSLLLAAWAVLFYFALTDRIDRETDDSLEARAETAIKQFLSGRALPDSGSGNDGCLLRSIPDEYAAVRPQEVYTDERIHIPERDAREPARVLRMLFRDGGGGWHELTVMAPAIEKNELTRALLRWVVSLYLVLLLLLLVVTAWVLHRTMRPLYALLRWLDDYTVGKPNPPLADDTAVAEFRRLNDAARRYAARAESLFERQKQFIGNASHEMQTPLAVCRNRLEMLVDDARTLTGEQLAEIAKVQRTLGHLVRLNRSLLLLSKIENGQFPGARGRECAGEADGRGAGGDLCVPRDAVHGERPGAARRADESLAGRERRGQSAQERLRARRRAGRGDRGDRAGRTADFELAERRGRSMPGISSTGSTRGRKRRVRPDWDWRSWMPSAASTACGRSMPMRREGTVFRSFSRKDAVCRRNSRRLFRFLSVSVPTFVPRKNIQP